MINWQQASEHVTVLGIGPDDRLLLALFPPKDRKGKAGCIYIEVSPGSRWEPEQVEAQLASHPGYSLGAILNPGGTKDREIRYCRALFFEDDGPGSLEGKTEQWVAAGLPRPSAQLWTGGKSVHHYWLLDEPCTPTEFRRAQKRLFRHVQEALPEADIDTSLCNPARILRLAGGVHPDTGEMARMVSAGGQRYSYEQLWNLTGEDPLPSTSTRAAVERFYGPDPTPISSPPLQQPRPAKELQELPEWNTKEHRMFRQLQVENDQLHKPEIASFRDIPRSRQLELVITALPFCIDRGPGGSGTYPAAFKVLAAVVNTYGVNDALQCAHQAGWGQSNWDIVEQVQQIEDNSGDRARDGRVTIFHLFDTAELNGWVRPWRITKTKDVEEVDEEDLAEMRAFKRLRLEEWLEARASNFRLADAFPSEVAALLSTRAAAFPVNEVAMLPPFITSMAAVMGTRYKVQIKKGWVEPMVFWMGSVGPASSLKTPVSNQILHPLLTSDLECQLRYKRELKEWKAKDKDDRSAPPPLPRKLVAGDATLEGLCAALENEKNHGMVSHHDELVAFIASMDAYRGRSGPSKDRAHWLSMWSGQEINILRKGHDPIFIPETAVSLFGCVQQDKLQELLHGEDAAAKSGDGFWARFLWCVPCNPFPKMNRDETEINDELMELMKAFDTLPENGSVVVRLSEAAWELFATQADRWSKEADNTYAAKSAFLGKMRGYAARFAGFLHALDYAERIKDKSVGGGLCCVAEEIPAEVMERALVLSQYFVNQFDVLAPQIGGNSDLPAWVVKIVELAQSREDRTVTARDLRSRKWGETPTERKEMLQRMVSEYGMGRMVQAPRLNQTWWQLP